MRTDDDQDNGGVSGNRFSGTFKFSQINLGHIILAGLGGLYGFSEHNFNNGRSNNLENGLSGIQRQLESLQTKTDQIAAVQIQLASLQAKVDQMLTDFGRQEERFGRGWTSKP